MKIIRSLGFTVLIIAGFAALILVLVFWVPVGSYPGPPFFDLAAQTIPILLVALAVEAQARRFDQESAARGLRIAAVILLASGQTAAILISASIYIPEPGMARDSMVVITAAGLLGGFFAVIAVAMKTTPPTASEIEPASAAQAGSLLSRTETAEGSATTDLKRGVALSAFASVLIGAILIGTNNRSR